MAEKADFISNTDMRPDLHCLRRSTYMFSHTSTDQLSTYPTNLVT